MRTVNCFLRPKKKRTRHRHRRFGTPQQPAAAAARARQRCGAAAKFYKRLASTHASTLAIVCGNAPTPPDQGSIPLVYCRVYSSAAAPGIHLFQVEMPFSWHFYRHSVFPFCCCCCCCRGIALKSLRAALVPRSGDKVEEGKSGGGESHPSAPPPSSSMLPGSGERLPGSKSMQRPSSSPSSCTVKRPVRVVNPRTLQCLPPPMIAVEPTL